MVFMAQRNCFPKSFLILPAFDFFVVLSQSQINQMFIGIYKKLSNAFSWYIYNYNKYKLIKILFIFDIFTCW